MPPVCKMLAPDMTSRFDRKWVLGEWQTSSGRGFVGDEGWLSAYEDPLLAAFVNPAHDNYPDPLVFEVEVRGMLLDDYSSFGATEMRLVRPLPPLRAIPTWQRIRFGILCAFRATRSGKWIVWASNWLDGKDRTYAEARRIAEATNLPWVGLWPMPSCFVPAACWAARVAMTSDSGEARLFAARAAGKAAAEYWCDTHFSMDLVRLAEEAVS
jgi:hypothetical protein